MVVNMGGYSWNYCAIIVAKHRLCLFLANEWGNTKGAYILSDTVEEINTTYFHQWADVNKTKQDICSDKIIIIIIFLDFS